MSQQTEHKYRSTSLAEAIRQAVDLEAKGEIGLAVQLLTDLVAEFPMEASVQGYLASYLADCGRFDEAVGHGRLAVQLSPNSGMASLVLFHVLWKAGQRSEAIEEIRRFLPLRHSEKHTKAYTKILMEWEAGNLGDIRD